LVVSVSSTPPIATVFLLAFMLFEFCVGVYYPCMYTLKATIVPESSRATIYTLFRVPMNALVLAILLVDPSLEMCWTLLSMFLALAGVCAVYLHTLIRSDHKTPLPSTKKKGASVKKVAKVDADKAKSKSKKNKSAKASSKVETNLTETTVDTTEQETTVDVAS